MDLSVLTIVLLLCVCLLLPLMVAACILAVHLLMRRRDNHSKAMSSSIPTKEFYSVWSVVPTASTAISIEVPSEVEINNPMSLIPATPRHTPFGTRRISLDLAASLKATLSKGPESLAAALEGVLALHYRLEELRCHEDTAGIAHNKNDLLSAHLSLDR